MPSVTYQLQMGKSLYVSTGRLSSEKSLIQNRSIDGMIALAII